MRNKKGCVWKSSGDANLFTELLVDGIANILDGDAVVVPGSHLKT
jgi:hypothetical protein